MNICVRGYGDLICVISMRRGHWTLVIR